MSHETATRILNRVLEGVEYPASIVNEALRITGDLDE